MGGGRKYTDATRSNSYFANNWLLDVIQLVVFKTWCLTTFSTIPLFLCHDCQDVKTPDYAVVFKISSISYQLNSAPFYVKNSSHGSLSKANWLLFKLVRLRLGTTGKALPVLLA